MSEEVKPETMKPLDFTSTRYAIVKKMDLADMAESVKMLGKPLDPFTGQIVLVEEDKLVVDKKSGISYCTKKTWDEFMGRFESFVPEEKIRHRCSSCLRDFPTHGSCIVHIGNYHSQGGFGEYDPTASAIPKGDL